MQRLFTVAETPLFVKQVEAVWSAEERAEFIDFIASNPESGDLIPGAGGIRKVRWSRAGTGKRGGVRVIYFFYDEARPLYLLMVYAKARKENLTPEETARMVEHVWELKQIRFKYYFFDENCSFRLLELLEIARPGTKLTEHFPLTAIPTDTVRAVKDAGLIDRVDYRPSRERELLARGEPLSHDEKVLARHIADDDSQLQSPEFAALPADRQALVQDTAFRLVRYRATGQERGRREEGDGTVTHHYQAEDVHDFAWTTSPDYLERTATFEHPSLPPVAMRSSRW